jgi:formate dehydrogenase maturation protein FdhE
VTTRARGSTVGRAFEERARRGAELAGSISAAREPLRFAAGLLQSQAASASALEAAHANEPWTGVLARDLDRLLPHAMAIARFAAEQAPPPLAVEAAMRLGEIADTARTRLELYWRGDRGTNQDYLSRAMLRPYVEVLRASSVAPHREGVAKTIGRCPFCAAAPSVALRRASVEGDGAARSLVCSLCALEWSFQRIRCPACAEKEPDKLPSFASESDPSVRIEACVTCQCYVKSILVNDARVVPEVDDLTSLALDLWASEQGLARIEPGLAGL